MNKKFLIFFLLLNFIDTQSQNTTLREQVVAEYTSEFCLLLEEHYGPGMMSEGGSQAIEHMFEGVALSNKKALDVGCGLGGVPLYLVETHNMDVTGLEINQWMVQESIKRIPKKLK